MEYREYGNCGFAVSVLGFGAGHIGGDELSEVDAGTLLNRALDLGITLFDTARGYGLSEERIGRHLSWRRKDFILSTKVGYGVDGVADWTGECIHRGIEEAVNRMNTDYIDIVHLHSCPLEILQQDDVTGALLQAKSQGKIRAAAYSGDNEALEYAAGCGIFDGVEASVNICDQRVIDHVFSGIPHRALGVIAKRPLANSPWRYRECPTGQYVEQYWHRFRAMGFHESDVDWQKEALLFTASVPMVSSCIVGSRSIVHLEENVGIVNGSAMPDERFRELRNVFNACEKGWLGEV